MNAQIPWICWGSDAICVHGLQGVLVESFSVSIIVCGKIEEK